MSLTFADQLFQNLDSLKNNSYKLSNDEIKLEGSITGDTHANIYGLNYELGTSSNFTVGEKVGEMSFKLGEKTPPADTDEITFNFNNDKVSGSVVNDDNLPILTKRNSETTISNLVAGTTYDFNILYDNNVIMRITRSSSDLDNILIGVKANYYKDLPIKENIDETKFKVQVIDSYTVPPENSFIEFKDTNGNTIWGFKFIIRTSGSTVNSITAETGYDILCYKDVYYYDPVENDYIFFKGQDLYMYCVYDTVNKKITYNYKEDNLIELSNTVGTNIEFNESDNIQIKGKVVYDGQFYIYIEDSLFGDNNLYLYYNINEITNIQNVKSNYFKAAILDDENNTVSLYNVSKPYPALLFISDEMVKPATYTNVINETINNINSTVLNDGVIYTIPRFVKN